MSLYPESLTILARPGADIERIADIVGKRVDIGPPASGRRATVMRILTAVGNTVDDFSAVFELPTGSSIGELCAGRIDASILIVGHPNDAVGNALARCGVTLVPVAGPEVDGGPERQQRIRGDDDPPGDLPRAHPPTCPTYSVMATVVTRTDMAEDIVGALVAETLATLPALAMRARSSPASIQSPCAQPASPPRCIPARPPPSSRPSRRSHDRSRAWQARLAALACLGIALSRAENECSRKPSTPSSAIGSPPEAFASPTPPAARRPTATAPARRSRSASPTPARCAACSSIPASPSPRCTWTAALVIEEGDVYELIAARQDQPRPEVATPFAWVYHLGRSVTYAPILRAVGLKAARANVAHHYDLDERLYRLFLDGDMQYSCAYFERPDMTLDQAQLAKKRLIAAKLLVRPGARVLDIGCGWGGMALYLARVSGADVTGITLSQEQHRVATERAAAAGLADRVRFRIQDYREVQGQFDNIVSVGMFEHVGLPHVPDLLPHRPPPPRPRRRHAAPRHVAARPPPPTTSPSSTSTSSPAATSPPSSEVFPAVEKSGLLVRDTEILSLHYAETTREWRRRFLANREAVLDLYDERFIRMWEFYLAGSESAFRHDAHPRLPPAARPRPGPRAAHPRLHPRGDGPPRRRRARLPRLRRPARRAPAERRRTAS